MWRREDRRISVAVLPRIHEKERGQEDISTCLTQDTCGGERTGEYLYLFDPGYMRRREDRRISLPVLPRIHEDEGIPRPRSEYPASVPR